MFIHSVRVGVAGLGLMGKRHAEYFHNKKIEHAELTAVCDLDPKLMGPFRQASQYQSVEEMISKGNLDAIVIATPHHDHITTGRMALEAGLHVLMEKPMASKVSECETLLAAQKPNQIFGVNLVLRTEPAFEFLQRAIAEGQLGEIHRWSWTTTSKYRPEIYYKETPWRGTWKGGGGGVLLNQAIHHIDLANWLFGMPSKLTGHCSFGRHHSISVDDEAHAFFHYSTGATGTFITSTGEYPGTNNLEIACDRGLINVLPHGLFWQRTNQSVSDYTRNSPEYGSPDSSLVGSPQMGEESSYMEILQNFVDAIRGSESLIAPATAGKDAVEVANSIILSSITERPVSLPLNRQDYDRCFDELVQAEAVSKETSRSAQVRPSRAMRTAAGGTSRNGRRTFIIRQK
jgi:predicted dehydrogenase